MDRLIKLHGSNTPFPDKLVLKSGPMTMLYQNGTIRHILKGETEILRMVYVAVRDPHWITVEPEICNEKFDQSTSGFSICFKSRYVKDNIDFEADISIEAGTDRPFIFTLEGKANSTFYRNRIGICVLHPVEPFAGKACMIIHPDGTKERLSFPIDVSPHQPFRNIAALQCKINEKDQVSLRFFGDIFETEDQRNWTDASFKTYSTPLELPFPVEIRRGTVIKQRIELTIHNDDLVTYKDEKVARRYSATTHRPANTIHIVSGQTVPIPPIGTGISSRSKPLSRDEAILLKRIRFSHLRTELFMFDPGYEKQYQRLHNETQLLDLPAELCMIYDNAPLPWFHQFLKTYRQQPVRIKSILLLSKNERTTSSQLLYDLLPVIKRELPGIPVGAGTNGNFAQLNRNRPDPSIIDFLSFAIHPQEHANDDDTLFENMEGQKYAVQTARKFPGKRPVHISPVTLQRRFNANISNYEIDADYNVMPAQVDVRQMSLAGTSWAVGSLKYLIESEAASLTYFETVGERGFTMGDFSSRWPDVFRASAGMCFPVYHLFRFLTGAFDYRLAVSKSNRPLVTDGFALIKNDYGMLFLSNMTNIDQEVELTGVSSLVTLFFMNEINFHELYRSEFEVSPSPELNDRIVRLLPFETRIIRFKTK